MSAANNAGHDADSCRPTSTLADEIGEHGQPVGPNGRTSHRPIWDQITDARSPAVAEALERTCDLCGAAKGVLCINPIDRAQPLPGGRLVHLGRTQPR